MLEDRTEQEEITIRINNAIYHVSEVRDGKGDFDSLREALRHLEMASKISEDLE